MHILLLSRYDNLGASSRIRMFQYIPYLQSQGIEVTVAPPLLGNEYLADLYAGRRRRTPSIVLAYLSRLVRMLKCRHYDLLWIEKELFPWLPSFVEQLLASYNIPFVLDLDDAIFHSYDEHQNRMVRILLGKKIRKVISLATWTVVGNPYLERYARKITTRVSIIPSVIDYERYAVKNNAYSKKNLFTIGWIGSPPTANCIQMIGTVLKTFFSKHNGRLLLVGSGEVELPGVPIIIKPWSEETELDDIMEFDVGVMPLYDNAWHRGKSGFKLIQYMASGKPVIASPVGVNVMIVKNHENGFIAETDTDWLEALTTLYYQPEMRLRMGQIGKEMVKENYSLQVTAPFLLNILNKAFSSPTRSKWRNIRWIDS